MNTITGPKSTFASDRLVVNLNIEGAFYVNMDICVNGNLIFNESANIQKMRRYFISDIFEAFTPQAPVSSLDMKQAISAMAISAVTGEIRANVTGGEGGGNSNIVPYSFTLFPGKTSENLHNALLRQNTTLSDVKTKAGGRSILTTRTSSNLISMKHSEIAPLYFIQHSSNALRFHVQNLSGNGMDINMPSISGIISINTAELVRQLGDYFEITCNGYKYSIAIEVAPPSAYRRIATFRNSFGVFERIALTGRMTRGVTFTEAPMAAFDPVTQGFELRQPRRPTAHSYKLFAGYKNRYEYLFMLDLLNSEEIYLSDETDSIGERVILCTNEFIYFNDADEFEPREVELTFKPTTNNSAFTPL